MALTNLAVFGGAFFTPILVGKMTHTIGWPWSFYLVAIFTAVCLPCIVFFVPETAYRRSAHLNTDLVSTDDLHQFQKPGEHGHELTSVNAGSRPDSGTLLAKQANPSENSHFAGANTPKKTFKENLSLFSGRKTDDSFFKLFLRPFPLFAHPAILWACLIQGTMIGWTVFIGVFLAAIFLGPPLFWNEINTGYAYTGAFVGAIFGFIVAGALADWSAKYLTRKNNGIYEPEYVIS
jgi:MFS family permease